uniref:protein-ribulosamine 3-kinase n=1 Tax=Podospora anserina (strain S / ATCC MYA-4624 / DSM 980 / FGSC 10383) TaxID=515849 RepID=A0A090CDT8_PODAN|nr:Putative fructosamine-3-kinase [Podospora anserina S mat+]
MAQAFFGKSLWGKTGKLTVKLPDATLEDYFLKVIQNLDSIGKQMCHGEFESLKAIHSASPGFVPKPYARGRLRMKKGPAEPTKLASHLADMHLRCVSPTGKFGFHIATCRAKIIQVIDVWDDSWCVVFRRHLGHITSLASPVFQWPEVLKPSLIHGDCWDGNTAVDRKSGEAFIFDACSFHRHNEHDTGNWRAPRHNLSGKAHIENYELHFPVSEPGRCHLTCVYEDMRTHCTLICLDVLREEMQLGRDPGDTEGGLVSSETRLASSNMSSEEIEIAEKDRLEVAEN